MQSRLRARKFLALLKHSAQPLWISDQATLIVQVVGDTDKIDAMVELLKPYGIRELSRTGVTAMIRGIGK